MGKYEVNNVPGEPYTAEYDITGYGTDFKIVVADYACNEFEMDASLDLGSLSNQLPARKELSKDRLYGCETFSGAAVESGWFSANRADFSDARNETFDSARQILFCGICQRLSDCPERHYQRSGSGDACQHPLAFHHPGFPERGRRWPGRDVGTV